MAILPGYDSKRNIDAGLAEPMRDEAAFPFEVQQKITGTLQNIGEQWKKARDVMNYTEAKALYGLGEAKLMQEAMNDPNYNDDDVANQYAERFRKLKEDSVKVIKDKGVANKFSLEADYDSQIASIKTSAIFKKKQIDYNRDMVSVVANDYVQKSLSATTPAERESNLVDLNNILQGHIATGTITSIEAEKILYDAKVNIATFDAQYNPDKFFGDKDVYGLNTEDLAKVSSLAEKSKTAYEKEMENLSKEQQKQNVLNLTQAFFSGQSLSVNDIYKQINNGDLPVDFGNAFINAIITPKLTKEEIAEDQFMSVINELLAADNERGVLSLLTETLKKTGKIRQTELNSILKFATENMQTEKRTVFQHAIHAIKTMHAYSPAGLAVKGIMKFIENVNKGDDAGTAKSKAEHSVAMEYNPNMMNLSDNGTVMIDPVTKIKKRVFKDGRVEDVN
jgi:hypothetical protein